MAKHMRFIGSLLPTLLLTVVLTMVACPSVFADFSVPKTIEHDLPPQSSEFEISTFSFEGMQNRSETPSLSVPVFVKLLSHQSVNKENLHKGFYRQLFFKGMTVNEVLFSKRLTQCYYTLQIGCLRL